MILFHGSNVVVDNPDVLHSRSAVDFGAGFYTTPLELQARKWCERFVRQGEHGVLSKYEFDETAVESFSLLQFDSYSREWLDYIAQCRLGNDPGGYDVIVGGVANDKVFNTCELFFRGLISADEALDRLRFEKPNSQYCFKTQEAIDKCLHFLGSEQL